jgi:hypothetical protein
MGHKRGRKKMSEEKDYFSKCSELTERETLLMSKISKLEKERRFDMRIAEQLHRIKLLEEKLATLEGATDEPSN